MAHSKPSWQPLPFYKKRFIVNPRFQLELTIYFGGVLSICLGGMHWKFMSALDQFKSHCNLSDTNSVQLCEQIISSMHIVLNSVFTLCFPTALIFVLVGGIYLSHRAAGPLYRLKQYFGQLAEGHSFEPIKFRKDDYFSEVTEVINKALTKLANK